MEDVIVRRRSQWTVDFRWCWRQSGRGLTWMDNCRCRGTAGAGVVSYHHERWIMIIKFFQWVPFAHSFELGWHASVLFFWVRKLAPCITCLQYSAIWVGLLQIRQEEVGKRWDKYNIYIYIYTYIYFACAFFFSLQVATMEPSPPAKAAHGIFQFGWLRAIGIPVGGTEGQDMTGHF